MQAVEILETIMLICFGFSWPNNIMKSLRTKSSKGKSLLFLILVDTGYVCGIAAKLLAPKISWFVLAVYIINFCMVFTDLCLWLHYYRKEKREAR